MIKRWLGSLVLVPLLLSSGQASQELDREFLLEKIGAIRSIDNVDGIFSETNTEAFNEFFAKQTRFKYQDVSKADALLNQSKLPYEKIIEDSRILAQIGKAFQLQSLIRTKIFKDGTQYRVEWDWIRLPQAQTLAQHSFIVQESESSAATLADVLKSEIKKNLPKLLSKLPYKAHITGRDGETVIVNVGKDSGVYKGDVLIVQTIEDVKIHPLSKAVVDWKFIKIGRLKVEEADESISFCKVMDLEEDKEINKLQKITSIIPHEEDDEPNKKDSNSEEEFESPYIPRIGWVSGIVAPSFYSRDFTDSTVGGIGKTGGGISLGLAAEAQLWLNRSFFFDLQTGFNTLSYAQKDISTNVETASVGGTFTRLRANLGYQYHLTPDFFGPRVFMRFGYQSHNYSLPVSAADLIAGASFGSVFLGVGADLPLRPQWGMLVALNMGLLKSVSAVDQLATPAGAALGGNTGITDLTFYLGGYYWFNPRIKIKAGIDIISHGANFGTTHALSHRLMLISPALVYYF